MSRFLFTAFVLLVFSLGWVCSSMYTASGSENTQMPFLFNSQGQKVWSTPSDRISEDQIHVYDNKVVLDLEDATWSTFTPTHSMEPMISEKANGLEVKPKSFVELNVGDVISYKSELAGGIVIHRITETGFDTEGWYAIVKGDNNSAQDPGKVRFSQINGVLVGVIY
ncbi:hypothetical protein KY308_02195 [Candidatus Woesearchaeota archaeon]|nr:hypothetical protein [Candidatus Woesearchaeota archaeon]